MPRFRPAPVGRSDEGAGGFLRRAREERAIPLEDVALQTKIKLDFLRLLEEGRLDLLPAEVFVGGFARAYARAVGADVAEASRRIAEAYSARRAADVKPPERVGEAAQGPEGRRRFGVVLVVLVILIAATLTLSLLLRRPGPTAGGLSLADDATVPRG